MSTSAHHMAGSDPRGRGSATAPWRWCGASLKCILWRVITSSRHFGRCCDDPAIGSADTEGVTAPIETPARDTELVVIAKHLDPPPTSSAVGYSISCLHVRFPSPEGSPGHRYALERELGCRRLATVISLTTAAQSKSPSMVMNFDYGAMNPTDGAAAFDVSRMGRWRTCRSAPTQGDQLYWWTGGGKRIRARFPSAIVTPPRLSPPRESESRWTCSSPTRWETSGFRRSLRAVSDSPPSEAGTWAE